MVKFLLHFLFLFAAVALVARRGEKYFWWALGVLCGGIAANAVLPKRNNRGGYLGLLATAVLALFGAVIALREGRLGDGKPAAQPEGEHE